jgi:4,5-dihydroxyphthalate decarboxylase
MRRPRRKGADFKERSTVTVTDTKLRLHALLGDYPNTKALKNKQIRSDIVDLDFADVKVVSTAFKPLVREGRFDVGELAIVTYLQAKAYGKPYVLIPAVVMGRGQHHTIAYDGERGRLTPKELEGRRVGVRAYTVTTGVWLRGILADDYGVDLDKVRFVTFEDPHVAEYRDPDFVERAPAGKTIVQMLLDGELDAAVVGDSLPDPRLTHLFPDPEGAARQWAERNGGMPLNHMVVIREEISGSRPEIVREIYRLLRESKQAANLPATDTVFDALRFGVEPIRRALEMIVDYSLRQKLIPRRFSVDELFDDTTRALRG